MEMEGFSRRGRFTCYHGEGDHQRDAALRDGAAIQKSIMKFYVEAARRLPLEQMPELVDCIRWGGHCIGLADPVSNIILNAIRWLPSSSSPSGGEHPPPAKRIRRPAWVERDWGFIASQSYFGLLVFMGAYFRYLTDTQASCYLYVASYDLSLAIKLVHHDRCFSPESQRRLLPDGGKIKAALCSAALSAGHSAPADLAELMAAHYPSDKLQNVVTNLQGDKMLSTGDVWGIWELLAGQQTPTSSFNLEFLCRPNGNTCTRGSEDGTLLQLSGRIGGNLFAQISIESGDQSQSLQQSYISDLTFDSSCMEIKLSKCLMVVNRDSVKQPASNVNYDASQCDHILSLKMCLLDAIHALYINALSILPTSACDSRFLRALLVAGHCYGPMDPVSNIIVNSIWYNIAFPACEAHPQDHIESQGGILDTSYMSRLETRSLNALVAIVRATSDAPSLSTRPWNASTLASVT